MKIGMKVTLLMVALNILCVGAVGTFLILMAWDHSEKLTQNFGLVRARQAAGEFDKFLEEYWQTVNVMTLVMEDFESVPMSGRRAILDNITKRVLNSDEYIASAWGIWDPDAVGDNDLMHIGDPGTDDSGRFVPGYVRRLDGTSVVYLKRNFDNDDFYFLPKNTNRQILTNPYTRVLAGEERTLATISAPVHNSAGQVVGVAGIDISMNRLNSLGQNIETLFDGTLTMAYSNNGTVISHYDNHLGGKISDTERDILGSNLEAYEQAVKNGEEKWFNVSAGNGEPYWFFSVPIYVSDFPDAWAFVLALPMNEVRADSFLMITFAVIACLGMIVLGIIVSMPVSKSVAKPIENMAVVLKDIATGNGDLTVSLEDSAKDEIGEASRYFNQTIAKIRNLVVSIKGQADELSDIGIDLAENMTETASAMNEIASNLISIKCRIVNQSASVTETHATMEQVTVNIDKLNGHVERQANAVSQASSAIEQMLASIQSVTTTLVKNAANVIELQESADGGRSSLYEVASNIQEIAKESEGLMEINAVMENIASQTNLLAMNAAIEAAHAGGSGKGFAVVADEIRKLAESSGDQSKTVGAVLKRIKESIEKITSSTDIVLTKFEAIEAGVKTVAEQEEVIRSAMEEQSEGSRQVLHASSQVSDVTQQVKYGSLEMLEGSREVIQESQNLESATQEITGGINEMSVGADEVNKAIHNVNALSIRNRGSISALVEAVSQFKV